MQVNCCTGEVYAMSKAKASGEEIELMTLAASRYLVTCWWTVEDEVRWYREFTELAAAVEEYNRWAKVPERVPTFN